MLNLACAMYRWRKRFDVYVCTAAERQYALEVWRLLDPGGKLIPDHARQTHFRAGVQKKDIAAVLGLPANPGCLNRLRTAMPLALVLDDRRQVRLSPPGEGHPVSDPMWRYHSLSARRRRSEYSVARSCLTEHKGPVIGTSHVS